MLGSFGLWSSSKGMVLVPNLSGLTNTQAEAAILSAGLTFSGSSSTTTSNSALSNKIASQLPNANDLVEYGSSVSFIYYNYVPVTTTTTTTTAGSGGGGGTTTTTTATPVTPAPITISNLTYTAISSTTGNLSWTTNGDTVLFTGSATNYPAPYNYGTYTPYTPGISFPDDWAGRLVNMTQGQSYTVTVSMYQGASQTITFTHSYAVATTTSTTTTTTTASLPSLPTPTLSVDTGWETYPNSMYANVTVTNFDQTYTTTYTSSLGTHNPEFPEEFNLSGLTPNQSYTVYVTASKAGATSTGSITFTAAIQATTTTTTIAPTTTTTTTAGLYTIWSGCYQNGVTQGAGYGSGPTASGWTKVTSTTGTAGLTEAEIRALIGGGCASTTTTTTTVAPTTTTTTTVSQTGSPYWTTGCCSTDGLQKTGTSNSSFGAAYDNLDAACPTGVITNTTSGNYGTIPTISCTPVTTTTTTTVAPTTTTTTTAAGFAITGTTSTSSTIRATWANPPVGTAFYEVSSGLSTTNTGSLFYEFTGLSPSTTYTYTVNAKSSSNSTLATRTASITTSAAAATTTTTTAASPVPSGGSVTLTGGNTPGSVITASTSGWSGSPTSYSIVIRTSTSGTPTLSDTVVASGTSSATYTITSSDAVSPVNIFKAFATATNASGTSTPPIGSGTISATPAATTTTTTVAPTTTTTTVAPTTTAAPTGNPYWTTGCCSTTGNQVTGTSSSGFGEATTSMNNQCSGTVTNVSSGNYGTIPTKTCTAPATTTTTSAPVATTTTTAAQSCDTCVSYSPSDGTYPYTISDATCSSGSRYYRICVTPGACPNKNDLGSCVPATATTTTAAPNFRTCNSFDVANEICLNTGCSSGGCASGAVCSTGPNRCL